MLAALDTEQVFQTLATRLNGPRAVAHRLLLRWEFTDSSETWTTLVGNGVLTPLPDDVPGDEPPQAAVCLPRTALDRAVAGVTGLADAIASGEVSVAGDADALSTLLDLFDEVSADFAIVLP
ncbi:alkyl sulfatase C-terminal domain-containing protein [Streptomyces sp. NPDC017979]|uniref:alkyl sulfatase C-terminal domain-containing protein n=1 Tax=Streptomyces sp. NPDC017979 TaxID=3365024 RepID=UPI0037B5A38B